MKRFGLLLALLGLVLSSCVAVIDEEPGRPPEPPRPQMCPRIYDPVCAERFGERETFSNACVAQAEGYRVNYEGECRGKPDPVRPPRPPRPEPGDGVACPMIHAPVCAQKSDIRRTFGNACMAEGSGFTIIRDGNC